MSIQPSPPSSPNWEMLQIPHPHEEEEILPLPPAPSASSTPMMIYNAVIGVGNSAITVTQDYVLTPIMTGTRSIVLNVATGVTNLLPAARPRIQPALLTHADMEAMSLEDLERAHTEIKATITSRNVLEGEVASLSEKCGFMSLLIEKKENVQEILAKTLPQLHAMSMNELETTRTDLKVEIEGRVARGLPIFTNLAATYAIVITLLGMKKMKQPTAMEVYQSVTRDVPHNLLHQFQLDIERDQDFQVKKYDLEKHIHVNHTYLAMFGEVGADYEAYKEQIKKRINSESGPFYDLFDRELNFQRNFCCLLAQRVPLEAVIAMNEALLSDELGMQMGLYAANAEAGNITRRVTITCELANKTKEEVQAMSGEQVDNHMANRMISAKYVVPIGIKIPVGDTRKTIVDCSIIADISCKVQDLVGRPMDQAMSDKVSLNVEVTIDSKT